LLALDEPTADLVCPTMPSNSPRPSASSANALATMRATRATSRREVEFRRAVWARGVRGYRVHPKLPGRPDMYFPRLRLAVFVHGCFWHRCASCALPEPQANAEFWRQKFDDNLTRDRRVEAALESRGIEAITIWEHELRPNPGPRAQELAVELCDRRQTARLRQGHRPHMG
jgi:DNA mismatch endonuclease, patch repair protein